MSPDVSKEEFESVTQQYTDDLVGMGYGTEWRERVLLSAIKGYSKILKKCEDMGTPRNQPGCSTRKARRHKKVLGSSTWFQEREKEEEEKGESQGKKGNRCQEKNEKEYTQVFLIQHTRN